jgi:DNA-binding MarR family transcriptional regulator
MSLTSQVLTPQVSPEVTVFARLLRAHGTLTRELEARLVAEHGLTINDFETLLHLSREPEQRMRRVDLADRLALTPSGVTRLLDGLMAAGLVARASCPSDARVSYAVLTDAGRELFAAAVETNDRTCRELIGQHLSPVELAQLSTLLGRLPTVGQVDGSACTGETAESP